MSRMSREEQRAQAALARSEENLRLKNLDFEVSLAARRKAEEEATRSAREWETIFGSTNDAIWLLDKEQRVVRSNKAADLLFDCPCGGAVGRHCWEVVHGTNGPIPECPLQRARKSLHRETMELQIGQRWYLVTTDPILDTANHYAGAVHIVRDITEGKRTQAEKERQETLNRQLEKSEGLGRMAAAIAHHFNNQLQAVMMSLELGMDEVPPDTELGRFLTQSMESARKAAEVSSLMLVYLGQTSWKRELLDLSEVCRSHLRLLGLAVPQSVSWEVGLPTPGPVVRADEGQIRQVLTNLVTNAVEACGDGRGRIRLTVKTVPMAAIPALNRFPVDCRLRNSEHACVEVSDSGIGIAGSDIDKIFDPFFSRKFTGRGLGLPVVLGVVKTLGGAITVESEEGKGSIFRIYLPLSAQPAPQRPAAPASAVVLKSGTVLLVEDDPSVRQPVASALQRMGYTVLEAVDGAQAVEFFRHRSAPIRCVLCDLSMPGMDGWATLEALRKLSPDIPVILASGYSEAEVMAGDHPERPNAFLGKPYNLKELAQAIGRMPTPGAP